MHPLKTYFNWSSGKDAALALHYLLNDKDYSVEQLITTVNTSYNRVSMHGLRKELLLQQADAIGIPHSIIGLPESPSMEEYEITMNENIRLLTQNNFECAAYGDIFLEDIRKYRETQLAPFNIKSVFPLWKKDTRELMKEFIDTGFKAIVICVDAGLLDISFTGRLIDETFINDLPPNVDICGENGEFHTFCFDGPIFKNPVDFTIGENIYREYKAPQKEGDSILQQSDSTNRFGFWFCDLLPIEN